VSKSKGGQEHFKKSEEEILKATENLLKQRFPQKNILSLQIKKWRYAQPDQTWSQPFENPAEGLYLAGDAFGGPSLNGAIKSSIFLAEALKLSF
jgi:predicted NAD/FAD-dependent oxidoreductase